ncbi:MAG: 50S ribosomal protein L32 [Patescibacteria group bacterium]
MPQEPKKRHSRQRQGKRRHAISLGISLGVTCANCGTLNMPHTVCKKCGQYNGRQVVTISKKEDKKDEESARPQA